MTSRDLKKGQRRRMFVVIPEERVYLVADPDVGIPEEISPASTSNLETVFNELGSLLLKKKWTNRIFKWFSKLTKEKSMERFRFQHGDSNPRTNNSNK